MNTLISFGSGTDGPACLISLFYFLPRSLTTYTQLETPKRMQSYTVIGTQDSVAHTTTALKKLLTICQSVLCLVLFLSTMIVLIPQLSSILLFAWPLILYQIGRHPKRNAPISHGVFLLMYIDLSHSSSRLVIFYL
jgi:hypothetical protein